MFRSCYTTRNAHIGHEISTHSTEQPVLQPTWDPWSILVHALSYYHLDYFLVGKKKKKDRKTIYYPLWQQKGDYMADSKEQI